MDIVVEDLLDNTNLTIPGYFVKSTAPVNVEDDPGTVNDETLPRIQEVVDRLYQTSETAQKNVGLVIAIHGYNSGSDGNSTDGVLEYWYKPLCRYVNEDSYIKEQGNGPVFLGFRWSSERISKQSFLTSLSALPIVLAWFLWGGIALATISLIARLWAASSFLIFTALLGAIAASIVACFVGLRVIIYFRDIYRATQYGVPDLVELIRQLDQGLVERRLQDTLTNEGIASDILARIVAAQAIERTAFLTLIQRVRVEFSDRQDLVLDRDSILKKLRQDTIPPELTDDDLLLLIRRVARLETRARDAAHQYWKEHPIKLSFIGHSMGAHVTTFAIRILSDVFDLRSVGSIGNDRPSKMPPTRIGRAFSLGRLVLVAPDIPLLAITSGRANFLRSSLRRFEEAYLFSSEGDLALRIASTAANYFSFPAKTRTQGYRLGNVTVRPQGQPADTSKRTSDIYGVVNLNKLPAIPAEHLLKYLEVSVLNQAKTQSLDPTAQRQKPGETVTSKHEDKESIADLFTYFDCTDYQDFADYNDRARTNQFNVLIGEGQRSPLKLVDYINLFIAFVTFSNETFPKSKDVHGGYFWGKFSKQLIYRLAFVGFQASLDSFVPEKAGMELATLPDDLRAELERIEVRANSDPASQQQSAAQLQEKREIALRYFSWICEQKRIQVVVSPERYQVDVLGRGRDDTREAILLQEHR